MKPVPFALTGRILTTGPPRKSWVTFLLLLSRFSFCLAFWQSDYNVSPFGSLWIYLIWNYWILTCRLTSFIKFGGFSHYSSHNLSLSCLETPIMQTCICLISSVQFSSVAQSCPTFAIPWIAVRQASLSITNSRVNSDSRPSSPWCHPAISSSIVPFSFWPQSLPASESFPMSQLFAWGGQSTGASALASFLPKKSQGWSSSEWTGWISLQSKGLLRVFSSTTVQKHQFFSAQLSSQSNSHIHTWPQEKA